MIKAPLRLDVQDDVVRKIILTPERLTSDWASAYFERGYTQRWGLPALTDGIRAEVDSLWRRVQLRPRSRVADFGCGPGRYALAFAERGAEVVGIDSAIAEEGKSEELAISGGHIAGQRGRKFRCNDGSGTIRVSAQW